MHLLAPATFSSIVQIHQQILNLLSFSPNHVNWHQTRRKIVWKAQFAAVTIGTMPWLIPEEKNHNHFKPFTCCCAVHIYLRTWLIFVVLVLYCACSYMHRIGIAAQIVLAAWSSLSERHVRWPPRPSFAPSLEVTLDGGDEEDDHAGDRNDFDDDVFCV